MEGNLKFSRVADEPGAVHIDVVPNEARSILELLGGWRIDRTWPTLRERADILAAWLHDFGHLPQRTFPGSFLEGGTIEMGGGLVLANNLYDDGHATLLTVPECTRLISNWIELLATRPHKSYALPAAQLFEYSAHGAAALDQFQAAF